MEEETELEQAKHDAWVAQTMIASILYHHGTLAISRESASTNFDNYGIDITEDEETGDLLLSLTEKS